MYTQNLNTPSNSILSQTSYNAMNYHNYSSLINYPSDQQQVAQQQQHQQQPPQQLQQRPPQQHQAYQQQPHHHYQIQQAYQHQPHQPHHQQTQYQHISNPQNYYQSVITQQSQSQQHFLPQQNTNNPNTPNSMYSNNYTSAQPVPMAHSPQSAYSTANSSISSAESSALQGTDAPDSFTTPIYSQPNFSLEDTKLLNANLKVNSRAFKSKSNDNFAKITKTQSSLPSSVRKISSKMTPPTSLSSTPISSTYVPTDPSLDISQFTEEDIIILKNMLPSAEIYKWKYTSHKLSKTRSKKLNSEFCISKFHTMFGLPFNPKRSLLHSIYFLKADSKDMNNQKEENFEGTLGSSLPYIVFQDGWNSIDP